MLGNWRQVTVQQFKILHTKSVQMCRGVLRLEVSRGMTHPGKCTVTTCCAEINRLGEKPEISMSVKVRKGGGFFYGNKCNEKYTQSV